jgi:hypothetical protein
VNGKDLEEMLVEGVENTIGAIVLKTQEGGTEAVARGEEVVEEEEEEEDQDVVQHEEEPGNHKDKTKNDNMTTSIDFL